MRRIKLGLLMATVVGALLSFTGCGAQKINLNDYVVFEYEGYDGYGSVEWDMDYEALEKDLGSDGGNEYFENGVAAIEFCISGHLDKEEELSNGDKLRFTWNMDDEAVAEIKEEYNVKLTYKDFDTKVKGLEDGSDFDISKYLEIHLSGVAPQGELIVSSYLSGFKVTADKKDNLDNGDVVTFTIEPTEGSTMEEICAHHQIPVFDGTYKYKVKDLPHYVSKVEDIPDDVLDELKKQSTAHLDGVIDNWNQYNDGKKCPCGTLFETHKNFDSYKLKAIGIDYPSADRENSVILVYELHFSCHGDVSTYMIFRTDGILDSGNNIDNLFADDRDVTCVIDDILYLGLESVEAYNETIKDSISSSDREYKFEYVEE